MSPRRGDGPSRPGKSSAAQRQSILVFTEGKKTELHFQAQAADLHRHKAQEMSSDLLGKQLIILDGYYPVSPTFESLSCSPILASAGGVFMVLAIDEDADAWNTAALIIESG